MNDPKEMLLKFLQEEGHIATLDGPAAILFKKEGRSYFTFPDPADRNFFNLYCYFNFTDAVTSRTLALESANNVNKSVKAIKVALTDEDNPSRVSFGAEAPLPLAESFRGIFDRALSTIAYSVDQYAERLKARQAG